MNYNDSTNEFKFCMVVSLGQNIGKRIDCKTKTRELWEVGSWYLVSFETLAKILAIRLNRLNRLFDTAHCTQTYE